MSAFTVHEPPRAGVTRFERADSLVFVEDGFSWRAAVFSPFYLLLRGEWLALAVYVAAAVVLSVVLRLAGAAGDWFGWMFVLLNIVTGFELSELTRWSLARAGWREIAAVSGRGRDEAERRFFEAWLPGAPDEGPAGGPEPGRRGDGLESRVEVAVQGLARRLRAKFVNT